MVPHMLMSRLLGPPRCWKAILLAYQNIVQNLRPVVRPSHYLIALEVAKVSGNQKRRTIGRSIIQKMSFWLVKKRDLDLGGKLRILFLLSLLTFCIDAAAFCRHLDSMLAIIKQISYNTLTLGPAVDQEDWWVNASSGLGIKITEWINVGRWSWNKVTPSDKRKCPQH